VSSPLVSVVIATYNASHLLRYAIASVLLSDFRDFEIIVVGDHCTDDTESVVASFADARIRFVNLERNSGQQATPNNVGVAMARGEYLCFLNHDDMYLPHHLSSNLAMIRGTGADIVCSAYPAIIPDQGSRTQGGAISAMGLGFEASGSYSPDTFHVASSWFLRRDAALRVGPWKHENQVWVTPSQDWLFRAWRRGMRIHCTRAMSIVVLYSGHRRDIYRRRDSAEHERVFREVVGADRCRAQVLMSAESWINATLHRSERRSFPEGWFDAIVLRGQWNARNRSSFRVGRLRHKAIRWLLIWLDVHPNSRWAIRDWGWERGGFIRELKKFTG
jgi:glycosyltransferase involved in cell wall biosynthesis